MSIKVETALFCDDVRKEDNGKQIFIGVYHNVILVTAWPATLSLVVALSIVATEAGAETLEFSVRKDGKTIQTFKGQSSSAEKDRSWAILRCNPIQFSHPSLISVYSRVSEKRRKKVCEIPIRLLPDPPTAD